MRCEKCNRHLEKGQNDVVHLVPCGHCLCPRCTIDTLVNTRRFQLFCCPVDGCCEEIKTHEYNAGVNDTWVTHHDDPGIDLKKDPLRYFAYLDETERDDKAVVSVAWQNKSEEGSAIYATVCVDTNVGVVERSDQQEFLNICSMLHMILLSGMNPPPSAPELTPSELKVFALYDDNRFITEALHALATGKNCREDDVKKSFYDPVAKGKLLGSFTLAEVMVRMQNHFVPQRLQICIGRELSMIDQATEFAEFLSNLRLSIARTTVRNNNYNLALQKANHGLSLDPYSFVNWSVDNIEFHGKRKIDSWCHILLQEVQSDRLFQEGFIGNEAYSSVDGKDWMDIVEAEDREDIFQRVFAVRDCDHLLFSNRILLHLDTIANLDLPDANLLQMMEDEGHFDFEQGIPLSLGVELPEQIVVENCDEDPERLTMYERSGVRPQMPHHASFAKKETLIDLTRSAKRTVENLASKRDENSCKRFPHDDQVFLLGDCYPVEMFLRVKAEHEARGDFETFKGVYWLGGDFHVKINAFRCLNGKLFFDIVSFIYRRWRPSSRSLDWVLNCSDPRDIEDESFQFLCATYRNCCDRLRRIKGRDTISAVEMHDHMCQRSLQHPQCMAIFIYIKILEVILMLRDSEKSGARGDVNLKLSALRYLLILFADAHAPKYLRTSCNFLIWWECASTAMRELYKRFLFTKPSANGRPYFADLFVEKSIMDIRKFLKKKIRPGMEGAMYSTVPSLHEKIKARRGSRSHRKTETEMPWSHRHVKIGKAYVMTYNAMERMGLWGDGDIQDIDSDDTKLKAPDGSSMSASILRCSSIGMQRVKDYVFHWEINNPYEESRDEKDVKITLLKAAAGGPEKDLATELTKQTSTDPKEITKLGLKITKPELLEELRDLQELYEDVIEIKYSKEDLKGNLIKALCQVREFYFSHFPEALEDRIDIAHATCEVEQYTGKDERKNELRTPLLSLHPDATL